VFPLCMPAIGVIFVVVVPMSISAPSYVLPVASVSLADEISQRECDPCNSSAPGVSTIEESEPPRRDRDGHILTLSPSSALILPTHAFAIASALLLPGGVSSLLRLLRPRIFSSPLL